MHKLDNIFNVDLDTFEQQVIQASHQKAVLVDLWAEWCSPCRVISPILEKIAAEFHDTLSIAKVEVDEGDNMKLAGHYKVRGFPTLILFINGEEAGRFSGAKPLSFIREFIDEHCCH
ncbi:MAG: thioredoxin domain-containing protein [Gammaproteobacteria bacterium]|nr:thioredoxin domain-containing protein [Gammaproteobacteria bacterium]